MKPEKILLIVNPVSGRMKSKTGLFEILDELYRDGATATSDGKHDPNRRVTVIPTMHRGHATTLAADSAAEGYDTVVCCGGDGTFNETVSGLMQIPPEKRPALGYIPAGSTNDFAASMGLTGSLREAARLAVSPREMPLDAGLFSPISRTSHSPRVFTYIASFGAFTAASYSTPQVAKNHFGHLAYLLEGVKDFANLQPRHVVFDFPDGTRKEGDYVFGAVTNTTSAGGVVKIPAEKVSLSDGLLELFLVHMPKNPADLQRIATSLLAQDFESCPLIELHHVESVKVLLEENLSWSLDGEEAVGGKRIEISCIRHAINFKRSGEA